MAQKKGEKRKMRTAILKAASLIFARNTYTDASIRTIAREGGFPHALIRYYYPSKAELFDAVAEEICSDLCRVCENAMREVLNMDREKGFSLYIERLIEFSEEKPWVFKILLINISAESVDTIPGQARITGAIKRIREKFFDLMKLKVSEEELCRFTDSFNALVFYYLGTSGSAAWILKLEPESCEYRKWVHKTLVDIFLPSLNKLFQG